MSSTVGPVRVINWRELDSAGREHLLSRGRDGLDPDLVAAIRRLIEDVRNNGDDAVSRALFEFDGCSVDPGGLEVTEDEFARAETEISDDLLDAIRASIGRVRAFNGFALGERNWLRELEPGVEVGQRVVPIPSAGLFVPSGKGSYPSSLIQIATPAVVAGVPDIAIVVPPVPGQHGRVDPAVLAVASELGIARVFRTNGPAGIAALAFGTRTIPQAVKVLGPGSTPVQIAQMEVQRYGTATVMVLGPTESMIIADASADPRLVAADLLSEAEHGSDSAAILVTVDRDLVEAVQGAVAEQLAALPEPRRSYALAAVGRVGGAVLVDDLASAVEFANTYAPEHLQLAIKNPERMVPELHHAAEILIGQDTPFAAANYTIGVPAALPTNRFARVSSGVTAETFTKTVSIARLDKGGMERLSSATLALAEWEGFPAHAAAARIRAAGLVATGGDVREAT